MEVRERILLHITEKLLVTGGKVLNCHGCQCWAYLSLLVAAAESVRPGAGSWLGR